MNISIEFFGRQRIITGMAAIEMPINGNSTIGDVMEYIRGQYPDLPLDEKTVLLIINQEMASAQTTLKPNDVVSFLPAIGGG